MRHVTRTGRALRHGRTTRKSKDVKRPGVKPLPLHLQCHPQYLHRTPIHPGCATFENQVGGLFAVQPMAALLYGIGRGLQSSGPVTVEVVGKGTWYAPNLTYAWAWKRAAERTKLYRVNVYP